MRATLAVVAVAILLAPSARADRYRRGEAVFLQNHCERCHSVGWKEAPKGARPHLVDVTQAHAHRGEADLARFLADPAKVKPDTGCEHRPLTADEVADLLKFLKVRAHGMPEKPHPEVVRPVERALVVPGGAAKSGAGK